MRWNDILLFLNGELENPAAVRRIARSGAAILCADGGVRHAAALGLTPRLILGDMDSLPRRLPHWKETVYLCDFDQNASDFEKSLRFAARRKVRKVWVAGIAGGRLDHLLVNLALLESYSAVLRLELADGSARILGPGRHVLPSKPGQRLTLMPAAPQAKVTATGLRYPLSGEVLGRNSRGLSNKAMGKSVRLRVHTGRLWVLS